MSSEEKLTAADAGEKNRLVREVAEKKHKYGLTTAVDTDIS